MGHSWIQTLGSPTPMEVAGNFCLKDAFFPGWPEDSLMFCDSELTEFVEQEHCIPTYREKATESTGSTKTHQSPCSKENLQKPPHKDKESGKSSRKTLGTSSPQVPDSTSTSKTMCKFKQSPPLKNAETSVTRKNVHPSQEWKDKCNHEDCSVSTKPKESSQSEKNNK